MYIWNIEALREDLINNDVSEKEKNQYLFFFFCWLAILTFYATGIGFLDEGTKSVLFLYTFLIFGKGLHGILCLMRTHNNKDIINSFMCLLAPIAIRIGVFLILMRFIILIFMMIYSIQFTQEDIWGMASVEIIVLGPPLFFILMQRNLKKIIAQTQSSESI
jgi:hypothetical protein